MMILKHLVNHGRLLEHLWVLRALGKISHQSNIAGSVVIFMRFRDVLKSSGCLLVMPKSLFEISKLPHAKWTLIGVIH